MKTYEYLDLVREKLHLPSDYALQKPLGISKTQLSNYRNGRDSLSDSMCLRIAEICGIDAAQVMLDAHLERSKTPEIRAAWEAMMRAYSQASAKFSESFKALMLCATPCVSPMRSA